MKGSNKKRRVIRINMNGGEANRFMENPETTEEKMHFHRIPDSRKSLNKK